VSRYQKGKTNLDFTEARDSEWQWHQLGHMQVCILLQTDNHIRLPKIKTLTLRQVLETNVHHRPKFHQNRSNACSRHVAI